ncbi:TIGR04222 domain-containing protein [Streptomyces sp. yr375]|uniref:TIGR04222 domain-containing membrane protein n=1 Tax=Streptomyces sp. yr375 TaxID=1761906 RepID=UPI0008CD9BA6|nr:TIGR04222 domain-containing membrane protein [Streptomyces sp. yr375]SER24053.1 TIGR04222 domain-containing protein [Streptomyces sp. yr375]
MFWALLLLLAWSVAGAACTRLCLAAVRAAAVQEQADEDAAAARRHDLTLYEAAFLSGGPGRVADLTMVSMARQRRLLLARTGWATVVDPRGRDEMERSVIGAIGPEGQSRIAPVRAAASAADAVRGLADRLVSAGLAVPDGARTTVAAGVRQVRVAAVVVLALGATALLVPATPDMPRDLVALWFALPLALTLSCLAVARVEVHPYARWASPAGQRLLGALARRTGGTGALGDDRTFLTSVAVRGIRAVGEPDLRAAFAHREPYGRD